MTATPCLLTCAVWPACLSPTSPTCWMPLTVARPHWPYGARYSSSLSHSRPKAPNRPSGTGVPTWCGDWAIVRSATLSAMHLGRSRHRWNCAVARSRCSTGMPRHWPRRMRRVSRRAMSRQPSHCSSPVLPRGAAPWDRWPRWFTAAPNTCATTTCERWWCTSRTCHQTSLKPGTEQQQARPPNFQTVKKSIRSTAPIATVSMVRVRRVPMHRWQVTALCD